MRAAGWVLATLLASGLAGCASVPPQSNAELRRERMVELNDRARQAVGRGELRRAAAFYREALRMAEAIEDFRAIGINSLNLAGTWQALGEFEAAHGALDRVLATPSRFDQWVVAEAAGRKILLALQAGDLDAAGQWLARAQMECRAPTCRIQTALLNLNGQLLLERGALVEAEALADRAAAASRSEGDREEEANALRLGGRVAERMGQHARAVSLLTQALDLDRQLALPRKIGLDLLALAEVELARGERVAAREYAQRAMDVSGAARDQEQQNAAKSLLERAQ